MIDREPGSGRERARLPPALALPPLAWIALEYGLGSALRGACAAVGWWPGLLAGAVSLCACLAAWLLARPLARRAGDDDPPTRLWLARVAMLGAAVFGLAVVLQSLAIAIVPPCVR